MSHGKGISLIENKCILCEICVRVCKNEALVALISESELTINYDPEKCPEDCMMCVDKCPVEAISRQNTNQDYWKMKYPICRNCGNPGLPYIHFSEYEDVKVYNALCVCCRRKLGMEKIYEASPGSKSIKTRF